MDTRLWTDLAACLHIDPDLMYPDNGDQRAVHHAKQVCRQCPVRGTCYRQAVDTGEPWGVWGGFTEPERRRIAAGRPVRQCTTCSTPFVPGLGNQRRCGHCITSPGNGGVEARTGRHDKRTPQPVRDDIDHIAVAAALHGDRVALTSKEKVEAIRVGLARGMRRYAIARALHMSYSRLNALVDAIEAGDNPSHAADGRATERRAA